MNFGLSPTGARIAVEVRGRTIHSPAFSRSDEILYLVEKASDFTLPDFVRCPFLGQFQPFANPFVVYADERTAASLFE